MSSMVLVFVMLVAVVFARFLAFVLALRAPCARPALIDEAVVAAFESVRSVGADESAGAVRSVVALWCVVDGEVRIGRALAFTAMMSLGVWTAGRPLLAFSGFEAALAVASPWAAAFVVAASAVLRAVSSYQAMAVFRFDCILQVDPKCCCDENSNSSRLRPFAIDCLTT